MRYKRRVRVAAEVEQRPARAPRPWVAWAGAGAWLVTVWLCLALVEGWFPFGQGGEPSAAEPPPAVPARPASAGRALSPARSAPASSEVRIGARPDELLAELASGLASAETAPGEPVAAAPEPGGEIRPAAPAAGSAAPEPAAPISCEGAIAAFRERVMRGEASGSRKMTQGRFQAQIDSGSYLRGCAVPASMGVRICAAIQHGRVIGVTVHTSPDDVQVRRCVAEAVRALELPARAQLDVTHSRFAPL